MEKLVTFKVGSHLYGLENSDGSSDVDLLTVYRNEPEDYLVFDNYEDSAPSEKYTKDGVEYNETFWDLKKYLYGCSRSAFSCFETLFAERAYVNYTGRVMLAQLRLNHFNVRPLCYKCRGLVQGNGERGYFKAYNYLVMEYMAQTQSLPTTLNAYQLLELTEMDAPTKAHVRFLFDAKKEGKKDLPFLVTSVSDAKFNNLEVKETYWEFQSIFRQFVFYNLTEEQWDYLQH